MRVAGLFSRAAGVDFLSRAQRSAEASCLPAWAAQTADAEVFAAAGFQSEQESEHGGQFMACLVVMVGRLTVREIAVHDAPDSRFVSQAESTATGDVCDYPAQVLDIIGNMGYTRNCQVHVHPFDGLHAACGWWKARQFRQDECLLLQ